MSLIIDRALCLNDSPISHVSRNLVMAKHSCGDNLLLSPFLWHNQNYRVEFQSQVSHSSHPAGSKLHNAGARKVVWVPGLKFVSICAGYLQWNYVKEHQQRRRSAAEGKSYTISSLSEHCALTKDACNSKSQVNNVNIKLTAECLPSSATSIHSLLNTIRITLHAGSLYLLIWLLCMCRVWSCVLSIPSDAPAEICMRRQRRRGRLNLSPRRRHARWIMDQNYLIKTTLGLFFMLQLFLPSRLLLMELSWPALFFYNHAGRFVKKINYNSCCAIFPLLMQQGKKHWKWWH